MREIAFIKQNKIKWLEFEQVIFGKAKKNPDIVASLYVHLINDLSYAQTYYPKSKTVVYLNYLASSVYQKIYKTKREEQNRILYFFKIEVPLLLYDHMRYIVYASILFFVAVGIGVVSARYDDSFVRLILGDGYVNETLQNIKEGNPVAVYKSGSTWGSFIGISINNLYVAVKSFVYGVFAGIGTFFIILYNGIMVGSFQYFFYEHHVFWASVRGIWIHGTMEIFAIIIASASGLLLGASILFPKTYSRLHSFKIGFKTGLKIFLATVPFIAVAAFLEGFVTRYAPEMPILVNIFIILSTLACIGYYFILYPFRIYNKMSKNHDDVIQMNKF